MQIQIPTVKTTIIPIQIRAIAQTNKHANPTTGEIHEIQQYNIDDMAIIDDEAGSYSTEQTRR
jgi:hypothetical protein